MIIATWFTTTFNYILLYLSFKKIKVMAEKDYEVAVIREGTEKKVKNIELVPGDLVRM